MTEETKRPLYIPYAGPTLLETPLLNKGSAFDEEERRELNLIGLLPEDVETIDAQAARAYRQYQACDSDLDRHIFLRGIQDDNETLFYRLLEEHLEEMLPIIYTPTVGQACQQFSSIYRNHRGIFVSYPNRHYIDDIVHSVTKDNVKVIVVTDGERILGLGDQGIGGMGIPIGKLSLYTACGGISPAYTLPVVLDVGTNNRELLDDPVYMGWRHERIGQEEYMAFVDLFVQAVRRRWPDVLLQFEDFAQHNALPLLERYRNQIACFNDDIQGTAAVCVGSLLAACKARNMRLSDQVIVFAGAGAAGCGIAEQIVLTMIDEGLSEADARARIFMLSSQGLITDASTAEPVYRQAFAQPQTRLADWDRTHIDDPLLWVVENARPSVLIGVSGQAGMFTREIIATMHGHCSQPVVMPLSNPTSRAEAVPQDVLDWTGGEALVATGSPFPPATVGDEKRPIAQCNNSYIFPGIGLGVVAARASRVTDAMIMAASRALAEQSPLGVAGEGALLPPLAHVPEVSKHIAVAVARQAQQDGVALRSSEDAIHRSVARNFWTAHYRKYRRGTI